MLTFLSASTGHTHSPHPPRRHKGRGAPVTWTMSARIAERRARMREVGARMFARAGVNAVAILDVSRSADVPVSVSSHGYRRRLDLVFDILHAYVDALHEYVGSADDAHEAGPPDQRLRAAIGALLDGIHDHRDAHHLMLTSFPSLAEDQREVLRYQIRILVHRLVPPLEGVIPELGGRRDLQAPLLQSLIGMCSHAPAWFRDTGALSRHAYADLIAHAVTEAGRVAVEA